MKKLCVLFTFGGLILFLMFLIQGCDKKREVNETELPQPNTLESMDNEFALIITGLLVDENDKPMTNQSMLIYLGKRETTLNTNLDKNEIVKKVEGTGYISWPIEGVEGGGANKLIDGIPLIPSAKTDDAGRFRFEVSAEFLEGEEDMIIVRHQEATWLEPWIWPMIDENGKSVILKIEKKTKVLDLGRIRTLQK